MYSERKRVVRTDNLKSTLNLGENKLEFPPAYSATRMLLLSVVNNVSCFASDWGLQWWC